MRALAASEAARVVKTLGLDTPERSPGFAWDLTHLEALTDDVSVCLHRGTQFAADWVREAWIVAPGDAWLSAARRFCAYLFATGARQIRFRVHLPVDPRHEAVWSRYGARAIAVDKDVLTVALDDPALPPSFVVPWPHTMRLGARMTLGATRFGELSRIAEFGQRPRNYEPLGHTQATNFDDLVRRVLPADPFDHATPRMHLYTLRRNAVPIGVIFEHQRDYAGDSIREIDMVLDDEMLPPRTWAEALATIMDLGFRRGATRMIVNVREAFPRMAELFGADPATSWIAKADSDRQHYTATPAQFYASLAARRFLRHRKDALPTHTPLLNDRPLHPEHAHQNSE